MQLPQGPIKIGLVKYERLAIFCFNCGHIGHRFRNCNIQLADPTDIKQLPYGSWLTGVDGVRSTKLISLPLQGNTVTSPADVEGGSMARGLEQPVETHEHSTVPAQPRTETVVAMTAISAQDVNMIQPIAEQSSLSGSPTSSVVCGQQKGVSAYQRRQKGKEKVTDRVGSVGATQRR